MGGKSSKPEEKPSPEDGKDESAASGSPKPTEDKQEPSVQQKPPSDPVEYGDVEPTLKTGDLAVLYRAGQALPHFAVFFNNSEVDEDFPILLIKGKTKPMDLSLFQKSKKREIHVITAITRIFYGDYEKVAIRKLKTDQKLSHFNPLDIAEEVESIPYTDEELKAITDADSSSSRSQHICAFILAHVYHKMGVLPNKSEGITPENFQDSLPLEEPTYIKLPPVKPGPMKTGDPPFLSKIAEGLRPSPDINYVPYNSVKDTLQSGDIILFSGATNSGAIIKIFDGAIFSHVGIILRLPHSAHAMVWEASTNKAGLVDIDTGGVTKGVELLGLRNKIFSGWYDKVAVRKLTGLSDERRQEMYKMLLKVRKELEGVPYEKSNIELMMSAFDFGEDYLTFLKNEEEDLSSIFCSELVAHAYQKMGLLGTEKTSNEYTPDDFSSHKGTLKLLEGTLEEEVYIELKFDD